jgi:integrase/recombinase XerC
MQATHPIIQPFLQYLTFEKRYSKHTITAYETDLTSFFDYIEIQYGTTPLQQLTHTYIRSWLASLKDEGLTSKSLVRKISTLKSFFKYELKNERLQLNPMAKVMAPKVEKRLPQFVEHKDLERLFSDLEFPDDWQGHTDRLLVRLFYDTGMRLSEALNLQVHNIDFSNYSLKVLGKGNKERIIPASPALLKEMKSYLDNWRQTQESFNSALLFVSEKGQPLGARKVYTSVKRYLSQVTTIEKRSPHVLRHSFATHLMNNGADLSAVKDLLGHSSLAATQVYTHNTIDKLKNIYNKAHPKA